MILNNFFFNLLDVNSGIIKVEVIIKQSKAAADNTYRDLDYLPFGA